MFAAMIKNNEALLMKVLKELLKEIEMSGCGDYMNESSAYKKIFNNIIEKAYKTIKKVEEKTYKSVKE